MKNYQKNARIKNMQKKLCLAILKRVNSSKHAYGLIWIWIWSLNLHCKYNTLQLKWICHKLVEFTSWKTTSCVCACYFDVSPLVDDCFRYQTFRDGDRPRRRRPPLRPVYRQQGKPAPIDHVDKNPVPSLSLMHD